MGAKAQTLSPLFPPLFALLKSPRRNNEEMEIMLFIAGHVLIAFIVDREQKKSLKDLAFPYSHCVKVAAHSLAAHTEG